MPNKVPDTSIVIRTFNEERFLPQLLDIIGRQRYTDYEIIVVDSGSYDRTTRIASEYGARVVTIKSDDFTFGYSLNTGIRESAGRNIVIVSAHTEPIDELWLESLVDHLREPDVAMVYGRQIGNHLSKFSEVQDFRRTFGEHRMVLKRGSFFANNANSAVRKELWSQHPFDETLPGLEDQEWAHYWGKNGYKIVYEPSAAIYHVHQESWRQVYNRYLREAIAARALNLKGFKNILPEVFSESIYLFLDLKRAISEKSFDNRFGEIVQFRAYKTAATIVGIIRGRGVEKNVRRKHDLYFSERSKAVIVRGPGKASLENVRTPMPRPSEVLIKVAYEGVCGTDLEIYEGRLGYFKNGMSSYPITPGHEFSGWITKLGGNVKDLDIGAAVVVECIQGCGRCSHCLRENPIACHERGEMGVMNLNGGYAEYVVAPARFVHRIPAGLDLKMAALCEPLAVVHKGVNRLLRFTARSDGGEGQEYGVIGAGPIGYLVAQLLVLKGQKVVVYDKHPKRLNYFRGQSIRVESEISKMMDLPVYIEATGDPELLNRMLIESRTGATYLLLGLPYSRREFNFEDVVAYDKTIIGSVGSSSRDFAHALQLLPQLPVEPLLEHVVRLDQFQIVWEQFNDRRFLKTLLQVGSSEQAQFARASIGRSVEERGSVLSDL